MATRQNIATISYNTKEFLISRLNDLISEHKVLYYFIIYHQPEDDEAGKKHHWHVHVRPNVPLDFAEMKEYFQELDPLHPDKPLGCIDWETSSVDDAYLYWIHDPLYLHAKGQSRVYHYSHDDIICSDYNMLTKIAYHAKYASKYALDNILRKEMFDGRSLAALLEDGSVPLHLAPALKAYTTIKHEEKLSGTYRNGHLNHD